MIKYWVIKSGVSQFPTFFSIQLTPERYSWQHETHDALRFKTEEAAQSFIDTLKITAVVAEVSCD